MQITRKKGKTFEVIEMEDAMKDSMLDARKTLQKSEFSTDELFSFYNKTVERINADKKTPLAKTIAKSDIQLEESEEITKAIAIRRSLLFPGYGQISERPDKLKGKVILYSGMGLAGSILLTGINFLSHQRAYDKTEGTQPAVFIVGYQYSNLFILQDYQKFQAARSEVNNAYSLFTTSLALYTALYVYNILDVIFFTGRKEVLGANPFEKLFMAKTNENGFDFKMARVPTGMGSSSSAIEQNYIFSYSYHW